MARRCGLPPGRSTARAANYIGIAIDLERQLPNIKWLAGAHCDIGEAVAFAGDAAVRAVSDSSRLVAFADTLASMRQP